VTVRNFFLKTIVFILVVVGIILGLSSLVLPSFVSSQVESRLQGALHPEAQSMRIESSPGIKLTFAAIWMVLC